MSEVRFARQRGWAYTAFRGLRTGTEARGLGCGVLVPQGALPDAVYQSAVTNAVTWRPCRQPVTHVAYSTWRVSECRQVLSCLAHSQRVDSTCAMAGVAPRPAASAPADLWLAEAAWKAAHRPSAAAAGSTQTGTLRLGAPGAHLNHT